MALNIICSHECKIFFRDISEKIVSSFQWDLEDPKLLVSHVKPVPVSKEQKDSSNRDNSYVVVLWTSNEKGILLHEVIFDFKIGQCTKKSS